MTVIIIRGGTRMRPPNSKLRIGGPFKGLDLQSPQKSVAPDSCIECNNVYVDDAGSIRVRPGESSFTSASWWIAPETDVGPYYIESHDMGDVTLIVQASFVYDSGTPANSDSYYSVFYLHGDTGGTVINWIDTGNGDNAAANDANKGTWGQLTSVLSMMDSASLNGILYIAAGDPANGRKVWLDPSADPGRWGIDQREDRLGFADPTGVTTPYNSATSAGPNLTDGHTYRYYVTYYNTETGTESLPVEAGTYAFTTASGNVPAIDANVGSLDTSFNEMRVYRQDTTAGDDTAYFIGSGGEKVGFPTLFYYRDTGDDVPNYTPSGRLELGVIAVPNSDMLCAHKGRMWWRDKDNPSRVWFSEVYEPEKIYPNSSFDAGEPITGLFSAYGYLLVFSKSQVAIITGENSASFNLEVVNASLGCVSNHAIVQLPDGDLIWASSEAIIRYNGSSFMDISSKRLGHWRETLKSYVEFTNSTLNELRTGDQRHLTAGVDYDRGLVVFNAPTSITSFVPATTSKQLVYSYRNDAWTMWNEDVYCVGTYRSTGIGVQSDTHSGQHGILATNIGSVQANRNHPYIYNDVDNSAQIDWTWNTGDLDFGSLKKKRFYSIDIGAWAKDGPSANGRCLVDLAIRLDEDDTKIFSYDSFYALFSGALILTKHYDCRHRADRLQVRLLGHAFGSFLAITDVVIAGNEVEHR